ncbi:BT_3928 family protein [Alloprevotella sp. OH1205_COT-284]|uniref:BT_3928 family protein n=1 Tax=Alloprevotella sp. OH1205_COT-284 TaxID=2491043 RepID=UPI0013150BD1
MTKHKAIQILLRLTTLFAQWILAAVFLFSGFVKALDPLGMEHKFEAYCAEAGLNVMAGSLYLDVAVIALTLVEFTLGVYLLLGMRRRIATYGAFVFMLFMTIVTIYIYIFNPVPDCGCFGAAITLTNGETLAKNIVLLALTIFLLTQSRRSLRIISQRNQWLLSAYSLVYLLGITLYSLHYLPLIDFTGYALGTDIPKAMSGEYAMTFTYEKNGKRQVFTETNLPDSTWKYVDATTTVVTAPSIADFSLLDRQGEDISDSILADTGFVFIATIPHLPTADPGCSDALNDVFDHAIDKNHRFYCATTGSEQDISQWKDRTGAAYPFIWGSAEMLKAMVRSNPGLLLLKNGRIIAKWSRNNMPDDGELSSLSDAVEHVQRASRNRSFGILFLWFIVPFLLLLSIDRIWIGSRYYKIYHHYKSLKNVPQ